MPAFVGERPHSFKMFTYGFLDLIKLKFIRVNICFNTALQKSKGE